VAIGAAILRYRLYELDRIISRSLAWGLLTLLLGGGYAGIVLGLGQLLGRESALVVAAATLAVAALFQPARRRIQAAVDRRFNRRRYDTAKTVEGSAPGSVTRSTWTRSRPSCWRWSTRPCSRPRCRCGCDRLAVRPRTSAPVAHPERLGSWRLPGPFAQLCETGSYQRVAQSPTWRACLTMFQRAESDMTFTVHGIHNGNRSR
jgi:hypothetical protein